MLCNEFCLVHSGECLSGNGVLLAIVLKRSVDVALWHLCLDDVGVEPKVVEQRVGPGGLQRGEPLIVLLFKLLKFGVKLVKVSLRRLHWFGIAHYLAYQGVKLLGIDVFALEQSFKFAASSFPGSGFGVEQFVFELRYLLLGVVEVGLDKGCGILNESARANDGAEEVVVDTDVGG